MHEYGIAQEIVSTALECARAEKAERITRVHIEMSALADESEDSLQMYLETLARGTLAESAVFDIARVSVSAQCLDCQTTFTLAELGQLCSRCGSARVVMQGRAEFKMTGIEVE